MTIRDFLNAKEPSTHRYEEQKPMLSGRFGQRFVGQLVVAVLIFAAIVYCYDQENQIGEGVRTIVAMATADDQNMLAVNGDWAFPWQSAQEDGVSVAENQPRENLKDEQNRIMMILPASGLMERNFGSVEEDGTAVFDGIAIRCQYQQQIKAAAAGEILSVTATEKTEQTPARYTVIIQHEDGVQSKYVGLQEVAIKQGDAVRQGAEIGLITDDVLQFFVYENDVAVDPFLYLDYQTS